MEILNGIPGNGTRIEDGMAAYRNSAPEKERVRELFRLIPPRGSHAIDVGARDGHLSALLADRYERVTAFDLSLPPQVHPRVDCVQGDACGLPYPDRSFDLVLCAEVLEHIPKDKLRRICSELARVAARHVVIGVPYDQDIRADRTTCLACGGKNPPWGHVNSFNEMDLEMLFPGLKVERIAYVGETRNRTNALSVLLADLAGNPYGTYDQDEGCIHCGAALTAPRGIGLLQRACNAASVRLRRLQNRLQPARPNWIHVLYSQPDGSAGK